MVDKSKKVMKRDRNRAVLIIPWYGKLPPYFGVYLKSLANADVDVLWVSDIEVKSHPGNFIPVAMPFERFNEMMEKRLGVPVSINGWHRLCDFKPMYGKIFEDYIKGYDYWGFGDCDLVYGRKFNDFLFRTIGTGKYDAVSMQAKYLSGPAAFFRNTSYMRDLFMGARNWKQVCSSPSKEVFVFDECGGQFHGELQRGEMSMSDCEKIQDSFAAVLWRTPDITIYREDEIDEQSLKSGEVVSMKHGRLSIDGREISVFHFIRAKAARWFRCFPVEYGKIGDFRIDRFGFYYSDWQWRTRALRKPFRLAAAAREAIKKNGLMHLFRRPFHMMFYTRSRV